MLKRLLPCFILCVILDIAGGQNAATDGEKILSYFRQRCYENGQNDVVFNNLKSHISDFATYLDNAAMLIPNEMNTFCYRERPQLSARFNEISNDLRPCLHQPEKFLTGFMNTSFNGFLQFLCYNNSMYTKRFFNPETQQCRNTLFSRQESDLSSCFNRIFPPRSHLIDKRGLCDNIQIANKCFTRSLDQACPQDSNYHKLNMKLFQYISRPCSFPTSRSHCSSHYLNTLLLMMSILLSYIFSR